MRVLLLFLALLPLAAPAQTTYTSAVPDGQEGVWGAPSSWSPQGVPGPSDTAIVQSELVLTSHASVGRLSLRAGALLGDGTLTVTDSMAWTGGRLDARGFADGAALVIASGAVLAIRDGGQKDLRGRDVLVDGRLDWQGADSLEVRWPTLVHIRSGARWDITGDGAITRSNGILDILIDGTLQRSGNGRTAFLYPFGSLTVNGTLRVEQGQLALAAGSAFAAGGTGTLNIRNNGILFVEGGTYDFSDTHLTGADLDGNVEVRAGRLVLGTADFAGSVGAFGGQVDFAQDPATARIAQGYALSGTFGGSTQEAGVSITDEFSWIGGALGRFATLVIEEGATMRVQEAGMGTFEPMTFDGGRIVNRGRIVFSPQNDMGIGSTHEIHNEASGVIEILVDLNLTRSNGFLRVVNDGLFVKRLSSGTARWASVFGSFQNRGEVRVEAGRLSVEGSPMITDRDDTGRWVTLGDGEIEFLGRRYFGPDASLEGRGTFDLTPLDPFSVYAQTLRPGMAAGQLGAFDLRGPLPTFEASGGLEIDLGTASSDVISTTGANVLSGTLRIRPLSGVSPAVGNRYVILASAGGFTGAFETLDLPPGLSGFVETGADRVTFVVTAFVPSEPEPLAPEALALAPPAPNPVRRSATLAYTVPESGPVRLALVDALGREVAVVATGTHASGEHTVTLDARGLAPGTYAAVLTASGARVVQRLTVVR